MNAGSFVTLLQWGPGFGFYSPSIDANFSITKGEAGAAQRLELVSQELSLLQYLRTYRYLAVVLESG